MGQQQGWFKYKNGNNFQSLDNLLFEMDAELSFNNFLFMMEVETFPDFNKIAGDNHKIWDPSEIYNTKVKDPPKY